MKKKFPKKAFSLVELSVVLTVVAVLIVGIIGGKAMVVKSALVQAQGLTKSSSVLSIPDLALWLEPTLEGSITSASGGAVLSNNDYVSSWNDILSGSKISVTQGTQANQPKYLASGINSLPTLSFDGSSDILYSTTVPVDKGSNAYTFVAVWRSIALSSSMLMEQKSSGGVANQSAAVYTNSSALSFTGYGNTTASLATLTAGTNYINIMVVNNNDAAGNISIYLNSNTKVQANSTSPSTLNLGNDFFSVGARITSAGSYGFYNNIYFSEVMVFNRNLTPAEIAMINNYLSKKYNITLS